MGALASLIAGLASGEAASALRQAKLAAIAYGLAALAALCGLGFFIGALYIWASARYGALEVALGFGAGFLVIAGVIVLAFRFGTGSRARRRKRQRKASMATLGASAALAALPVIPALLRSRAGPGLLAGPAIALLAYAIYRENATPRRPGPRSDEE